MVLTAEQAEDDQTNQSAALLLEGSHHPLPLLGWDGLQLAGAGLHQNPQRANAITGAETSGKGEGWR